MHRSPKHWFTGVSLAVLGAIGVAAAQPAELPAPVPVDVSANRDVALSPEQMQNEVNAYFPQMEGAAASVRRQLQTAREQRDVVKVLCLNDKLTQVNVAIRGAQDRAQSLRAAVGQNDKDRSRHEFTVLRVLRDRVRTLVAEANQCVGEEVGFVGDSKVTANVDPNIPSIDPTEIPGGPVIVSPPPVVRSPIR